MTQQPAAFVGCGRDSAPTKRQDAATDDAIVFGHDLSVLPSGRGFAVWVQANPTGFGVHAAERR